MLEADFAGTELALTEFARDGRFYVDIEAAASAGLTAAGSVGVIVDIQGAASMGVTPSVDYTALQGVYGSTSLVFDGDAHVPLAVDIAGGAAWSHGAAGAVGYTVPVEGTASFMTIAWAEPLGDPEAAANWNWSSASQISTLTGVGGASTLGFMANPSMDAVEGVSGLAALAWQAAPRITAVWSFAGSALLQWLSPGRVSARAGVQGGAQMAAIGAPRMSGVFSLTGATSVVFSASGSVGGGSAMPVVGAGVLGASGPGGVGASTVVRGLAVLGAIASGKVGAIADVSGSSAWRFAGQADPGATIFKSLPASRARFTVGPRGRAFVVPPEPELREV